jgi:hypothetical protein
MIENISNIFQIINLARSEADQIASVTIQLAAASHEEGIAAEQPKNLEATANYGTAPIDDRNKRYAMIQYYVNQIRLELDSVESNINANNTV